MAFMDIKIELDENKGKGKGEEVIYKETVTDNTGIIVGSILVGALIIAGAVIYSFAPRTPAAGVVPTTTTNTALPEFATKVPYQQTFVNGDVTLGDPNAKVKIVEYGDYQCPFCAQLFKTAEPSIIENYVKTGKANMTYKDLIIIDNFVPGGHESADAALGAKCAADQGKFWEYHDALFTVESAESLANGGRSENSGNLTKDLLTQIAVKLGLDKKNFQNCYDSRKYDSAVQADTAEARKKLAQVTTPSTLINGELVLGSVPFANFAAVIDKYLK